MRFTRLAVAVEAPPNNKQRVVDRSRLRPDGIEQGFNPIRC
jgi:hypothetical protein